MTQKRLCLIDDNIRLATLAIGLLFFIAACNTESTPTMPTSATTATPVSEVLSPVATFVRTPHAHYLSAEPPACAEDVSFVAKMANGPVVLYQPEKEPVVLRDAIGTDLISLFQYSPDGRFVAHGFDPMKVYDSMTVYDSQTDVSTIVLENTSLRVSWNARNHLFINTRSPVDDGTMLYDPFNNTITRLHPETEFGEFLFFRGWTNDGRYLYYERVTGTSFRKQREWSIYDDDTGQHHILLTETHPEDELWSFFINWSPDLSHAVLRLRKRDANDTIYERNHYLMETSDFSLSPLEHLDDTTNHIWMGDSSGLLYLDGDTRMMRYDLATQTSTPFYESDTFNLYAGFSRGEAHWIAQYTAESDENEEEVLMFHSFQRVAYDGTPLDTIAFSDEGAWTIRVSPDGSNIAYSANRRSYESDTIHLYDVESGESTILEGDYYRSFEWINDSILIYQSRQTERTLFYDARLDSTCEFPDAFQTVDLRFLKDN